MSKVTAFKFGASGTAMIVGAGLALGSVSTGAPATSTFTVTQSTSDVSVTESYGTTGLLIGECLGLAIDGDGGFTVTDDYADIAIVVDWDDTGRTFDYSVPAFGNNAETSHGRVVTHSWATAGTKTVTITGYVYGQAIRQQTLSVTVVDPDTVSWTDEIWVDFNGDTTGMGSGGNNIQITTEAGWDGLDNSTLAGELVRVHFRKGATHTISGSYNWRQNANIVYFTTFGSGARPVLDASGGTFLNAGEKFYYPRLDGQRVVIDGYEFDGAYSPSTGVFQGANWGAISATNDDLHISLSNCTFTAVGLGAGLNSAAANSGIFFYNCTTNQSGWQDYICLSSTKWTVGAGCEFRSDPLSGANDDKILTIGAPNWPDHSAVRTAPSTYQGWDMCDMAVHNHGWASLSPEADQQPCFRYYQNQNTIGTYLASFTRLNLTGSRAMVLTSGPGNTSMTALGHVVCDGIRHNGTRASGKFKGVFATVNFGGVTIQNLVCAVPDLEFSSSRSGAGTGFDVLQLESSDTGTISAANHQQPSVFRNITFFSECSFETGTSLATVTEISGSNWSYTESDNLIAGDSHTGTYTAESAFSTGDNMRPVTGSAAESSATGTSPYFDFERTARGGTTNKGAHDAAAAQTNASAPSYSGSNITIAHITTGSVNQYQVTDLDLANWSNFDPYLIQYTWQIGGVDPAAGAGYAHIPYYRDSASDSGTITCAIKGSSFGGTATANSNTDLST